MKKLFLSAILLSFVISQEFNAVFMNLMTNLSRLQFKVGQVDGFQINGVSISK